MTKSTMRKRLMAAEVKGANQDLSGIGTQASPADWAPPAPSGEENCECQSGMYPRASRRAVLTGAGMAFAGAALAAGMPKKARAEAPPGSLEFPVPDDPSKVPGYREDGGGYGVRSQFETEVRTEIPSGVVTWTPLDRGSGIITPSGLHYERHHNGIPVIDPSKHILIVHGMVGQPMKYSVDDLRRFPSISRTMFLECSGNSASQRFKARGHNIARMHGLTSTSEWTGVPLSTILRQVGLKDGAAWVLAESADGAVMTRSVPLDKCMGDAFIGYAQNGEAIRPENGYPMRIMLPGWEGNISIKWLRRLEVSDVPFQTREETSKYSDLLTTTGKARQFSFMMEAKSLITFPTGDHKLPGPGFYEITGIAWTGRGKIKRVEVSVDGGKTWNLASLQEPVLSMAHTRFRFPWVWDGQPAIIESRTTDETGYIQPRKSVLTDYRGAAQTYHHNGIQSWEIQADGSVKNVHIG
jgi:sulfane dehydrogenase subunit SoxC